MTKEGEQAAAVISRIINKRNDQLKISPAWVATEAMRDLKALRLRKNNPIVYDLAHQSARQIARRLLAEMFDPASTEAPDSKQGEFFEGLQQRYPAARMGLGGEEPTYVLRDSMTDEDVDFNVGRMRRQSAALAKHADTLEAWNLNRRAAA